MLYNSNNQHVKIPENLTSKTHPHVFENLRETKEPLPHKHDPMFRLDQRATLQLPTK